MSDYIYTLPSGTELSTEAALGDLERAIEFLCTGGHDLTGDALGADLEHVRELLRLLGAEADRTRNLWYQDSKP